MTYIINKTNGTEIVSLNDGEIDTTSTDITLIGRNYKGFGESINENFVKLLENFASPSAPGSPITGQLWYDTSESRLKVFDEVNNVWRTGGGPIISAQQPLLVAGDIWFNNQTNQMYFFDGTDLVLIGPEYSAVQGQSGLKTETVLDTAGRTKTISLMYVANELIGIYSKEYFKLKNPIAGFSGNEIKIGFNSSNISNLKWHGTAVNADSLNNVSAESYLRSDQNDTMTGNLRIQNNTGLTVGTLDNFSIGINNTDNTIRLVSNLPNADLSIVTRTVNNSFEAIKIDTVNNRVGIFKGTPTATLDVAGSVLIEGDLTVTGNTVSAEVTNIEIEDKNIELAKTETPSDNYADTGGIILKGDTDHSIIWNKDGINGNNWTVNDHLNLTIGKSLRINNSVILDSNRLYDSVTTATGLNELGTLQYLNVDDININNNTISSSLPIEIQSNGPVDINNQRIENLAEPQTPQDSATKNYVDNAITTRNIGFSMDITDYTEPLNIVSLNNGPIQDYIEDIYPAADFTLNTQARIHAVTYTDPVKRELRVYRIEDIGGTKEWRHVSTSLYS